MSLVKFAYITGLPLDEHLKYLDAIPEKERMQIIRKLVRQKAQEEKTPWWKALGGGALVGGASGALLGALSGEPEIAGGGLLLGTLLGTLTGAALKARDDIAIDKSRVASNNKLYAASLLAEGKRKAKTDEIRRQALLNAALINALSN